MQLKLIRNSPFSGDNVAELGILQESCVTVIATSQNPGETVCNTNFGAVYEPSGHFGCIVWLHAGPVLYETQQLNITVKLCRDQCVSVFTPENS